MGFWRLDLPDLFDLSDLPALAVLLDAFTVELDTVALRRFERLLGFTRVSNAANGIPPLVSESDEDDAELSEDECC